MQGISRNQTCASCEAVVFQKQAKTSFSTVDPRVRLPGGNAPGSLRATLRLWSWQNERPKATATSYSWYQSYPVILSLQRTKAIGDLNRAWHEAKHGITPSFVTEPRDFFLGDLKGTILSLQTRPFLILGHWERLDRCQKMSKDSCQTVTHSAKRLGNRSLALQQWHQLLWWQHVLLNRTLLCPEDEHTSIAWLHFFLAAPSPP